MLNLSLLNNTFGLICKALWFQARVSTVVAICFDAELISRSQGEMRFDALTQLLSHLLEFADVEDLLSPSSVTETSYTNTVIVCILL